MNATQDFKSAVLRIKKLHPSAAVFARAIALIATPRHSIEELGKIISLDASMTADIIRLSNSGALGGPIPNGNIKAAIVRIGLGEVGRFLGLSFSKAVLNRGLDHYRLSSYDYWSNSVSAAILMALFAKELQLDSNEAYTLGILHGVGKQVINQTLTDLKRRSVWDQKSPVERWEKESVGFTSAQAGALLLEEWKFPPTICKTIEEHLLPAWAGSSPMLKMLNFCVIYLRQPKAVLEKWEAPAVKMSAFLEEFGIKPEELAKILKTAKQKHMEAVTSLGIRA